MKNSSINTPAETFQVGTWVVSKMSFGERIHQMQVDGTYCNVRRPVTPQDWDNIKVSVWEGSKPVFEGFKKDYKGDHSIFN